MTWLLPCAYNAQRVIHSVVFVCMCVCMCVCVCMWPRKIHLRAYQSNVFAKRMHIIVARDVCYINWVDVQRVLFLFMQSFCNIMVKLHIVQKLSCSLLEMQEKPTPMWQQCIEIAVLNSLYSTQCSMHTGYVFCRTLVGTWTPNYYC